MSNIRTRIWLKITQPPRERLTIQELDEVVAVLKENEALRAELAEAKENLVKAQTNDRENIQHAIAWRSRYEQERAAHGVTRANLVKINDLLENMQPHIPQACIPGRESFIDNYIGPCLEICRQVVEDERREGGA